MLTVIQFSFGSVFRFTSILFFIDLWELWYFPMENWITIISFYHTMHVYLPKTKLESEGIEVILQDELTSQINPFNSFVIGGVKLLVKEKDFDRAHDLLNEWGYHLDDENTKPNKIILAFNRFTSYIPVVRKWIIVKRFIFLLTVLMLLVAFVILSFQDL